ncbi:MAG: transporter substrate-binding domain-containing protein [Pseudomonadota bacterium]
MLRRAFLAGIASGAVAAAPVRASETTLRAVADEWPPFSGSALPNKGLSLDVITTVLRRAGHRVEADILPWARIMVGARTGRHDIIGSLFFDPTLTDVLTYCEEPYYRTDIKLVRRKGSDITYAGLESLRPYSIAVGDGFLYTEAFDRAKGLNKIVVTTTIQGVQMVAHGRADLTIDSVEVIRHAIQQEDPTLADRVEFLEPALGTRSLHMAVSKALPNRAQVVADFNRVLAEMQHDGSMQDLLRRHNLT